MYPSQTKRTLMLLLKFQRFGQDNKFKAKLAAKGFHQIHDFDFHETFSPMVEAHSISSPIISNCKLSKHGANLFHDLTLYRSIVGALQYATLTRPKINFVVNKVCQFMASPMDSQWEVVKRILRYLKGLLECFTHVYI